MRSIFGCYVASWEIRHVETRTHPSATSVSIHHSSLENHFVRYHSCFFRTCYRNASPSGPWPWIDVDVDVDEEQLSPIIPRLALKWANYPTNLFPNWTALQMQRSGIQSALAERQEGPCIIYNVDVMDTGKFRRSGQILIGGANQDELWEILQTEVCLFYYITLPAL